MDPSLANALDTIAAESDFSGVVAVSRAGERIFEGAYGLADRRLGVPNTVGTRFALAKWNKGWTALAIASLIHDGKLTLDTTVRSVLTDDRLELVDPVVTVAHLLGHTSGVGDYLDEDSDYDVDVYPFDVPVQAFTCPSDYLRVIGGLPQKFAPGTRLSYCNGGYVMLALIIEAVSGQTFYDVLDERVFGPAGMTQTGFPRSDELPDGAATGYIHVDGGWRSNVFNLPVRGCGDGGAYSTLADIDAFWSALFAGRILPLDVLEEFLLPREDAPENDDARYAYGFFLRPDRETVMLEGMDAGVSFRTAYDRPTSFSFTVISNSTDGAWPLVRHFRDNLPHLADRP